MSWQAMRGGDDVTIIFASADHKATAIADLHDGAFRLLKCLFGWRHWPGLGCSALEGEAGRHDPSDSVGRQPMLFWR
jgi:hypothetical protein